LAATSASDFPGGAVERVRELDDTEHDYVALVATGAEAAALEATLASADRDVTERELDTAELLMDPPEVVAAAIGSVFDGHPGVDLPTSSEQLTERGADQHAATAKRTATRSAEDEFDPVG
jgi:hypothetical protein